MIAEKEILESRQIIKQLIEEGTIIEADDSFVTFFLKKAENSLETAKGLFKLSQNPDSKKILKLPFDYEGYLWVVNSAYYSMFYAATALLAKYGHRLKVERGTHYLTYHALVYYFLDDDKKLTKHILEQYQSAEREAEELLQLAERKAGEKVEQINFELTKRREFTYEMGKIAEKNKAETSIKRAEDFLTLAKELILE